MRKVRKLKRIIICIDAAANVLHFVIYLCRAFFQVGINKTEVLPKDAPDNVVKSVSLVAAVDDDDDDDEDEDDNDVGKVDRRDKTKRQQKKKKKRKRNRPEEWAKQAALEEERRQRDQEVAAAADTNASVEVEYIQVKH